MSVEYFGVLANFEAGQLAERAHMVYAGGVYQKNTNRKRNYTEQMLKINYRRKCMELLEDVLHV